MAAPALTELTTRIAHWKAGAIEAWYTAGRALVVVQDEELWRAGGFESFEDYLARGVDLSRAAAYRLLRVVRTFGADVAREHDAGALDAAITYLGAVGVEPSDAARASPIPVAGPDGPGQRLLGEASEADIRRATAALRPGVAPEQSAPPTIERAIATAAGVEPGDTVTIRWVDGVPVFSCHDIPADRLVSFLAAVQRLATVDLPTPPNGATP